MQGCPIRLVPLQEVVQIASPLALESGIGERIHIDRPVQMTLAAGEVASGEGFVRESDVVATPHDGQNSENET